MASILQLTFNTQLTIDDGDYLYVNITTSSNQNIPISLGETFRNLRTSNFEVTIPQSSSDYAENYSTSWNFDHSQVGGVNNLLSSFSNNIVTIRLLEPSYQFSSVTGTLITLGKVAYSINNQTQQEPSSVVLNSYSVDVSDRCGKCFANFTLNGGNSSYNVYEGSILLSSSQTSPISINLERGTSTKLQFYDTTGQFIGKASLEVPRKLIEQDISTRTTYLSTGASVNISVPFISSNTSTYEYSLDNSTYKTSNLFTGLVNGSYTVYVKDSFGCVTSKDLVIDGSVTTDQIYFFLSEINPIRFFDYNSEKKNYFNTKSCNELKSISESFNHEVLSTDSPTTQFDTSAPYINSYIIDSSGNTTSLINVQKTQNMGLKAKSTCTYFNLNNGKSGIYFGVVDMLDYDTNAFIKEVNFGLTLPEWANKEGDYVFIKDIGEVQISAVSFSDLYNSFILEFDISYTGDPVEKEISALYNINSYEAYEFILDISTQPDNFNIVIEVGLSSNDIHFTKISENINVAEDRDSLIRIDYWDKENKGGMIYQTGIKHRIRLNGIYDYIGEQEVEGYNGDKEYFITDNTIYNTFEMTFLRLSSAIAHKMRLISSHSELYINGVKCKLSETPEITGERTSNLKSFKAVFKQSGDDFLTNELEQIINTPEEDALNAGIEHSENKGLLLWTKNL